MHKHIQNVISWVHTAICTGTGIISNVPVLRISQPVRQPIFPVKRFQCALHFAKPRSRIQWPVRQIPWLQTLIGEFCAVLHAVPENNIQCCFVVLGVVVGFGFGLARSSRLCALKPGWLCCPRYGCWLWPAVTLGAPAYVRALGLV